MAARWARMFAVFFLVGLAASRLTLVLHELVGHGGAATLLGGRVVDYGLFYFGGGWIRYQWPPGESLAAALAVSMGGIALEVIAAAAALAVAFWTRVRNAPVAQVALVGFATADLLHAGFYLATGTHHGFGDGGLLHAELGAARAALVVPVAAADVIAGFLLGRCLARLAGHWSGARSRGGRAAAMVSAAAMAALAHGALTLSERAAVRDPTYSRIMQPESERRAEHDLQRMAAEARGRGAPLDERAIAAVRAELERRHRAFPLVPVLAGLLALAWGAGVWRGVSVPAAWTGERGPPDRRVLVALAAVTAASLALIAVLRALG
jgi:hypothetical protein